MDVIFLQRQKEESKVRKMEARIAEIRKSVDQRIEMLAPEKLKAYKRLAEEDFVLSRNVEKMRQKIDMMKQNVSRMESRIRHDKFRAEHSRLERRLEDRKEELEMLEQELNALSLDPQAAREYLLKRVRYVWFSRESFPPVVLEHNNNNNTGTLANRSRRQTLKFLKRKERTSKTRNSCKIFLRTLLSVRERLRTQRSMKCCFREIRRCRNF